MKQASGDFRRLRLPGFIGKQQPPPDSEGDSMSLPMDGFGRRFPYLRLSVTEACNFRCTYCLPNGYQGGPNNQFLRVDEIARLTTALAELGMWKVRITGGEPSVRRDLTSIIETVATTPGIRKVAMTTNGYQLLGKLPEWRRAGLSSLNVSIDSLDRKIFHEITGHDRLPAILAGLEMASNMEFEDLKINVVMLRGVNDMQLGQYLDFVRENRVSLRFIELMQTGDNLQFFRKHHLRANAWQRELMTQGWTPVERLPGAGPAQELENPAYAGRIGFIAPYSKNFCRTCNRLRITAIGDLRLCLFGDETIPLRNLLQFDDQKEALKNALTSHLSIKPESHHLSQGQTGLVTHLASTGG